MFNKNPYCRGVIESLVGNMSGVCVKVFLACRNAITDASSTNTGSLLPHSSSPTVAAVTCASATHRQVRHMDASRLGRVKNASHAIKLDAATRMHGVTKQASAS